MLSMLHELRYMAGDFWITIILQEMFHTLNIRGDVANRIKKSRINLKSAITIVLGNGFEYG